jgi:drug/metabolite transporter (DMT)-like permease
MTQTDGRAPYLWMLASCLALAGMNQLAHQLRETCDWRLVALSRAALAFVFAVGLAKASGARLVFLKPAALWVRGAASSVSLLCTFFALARLRTAEVNTLTNTTPIWVALLSWPVLRQRPGMAAWMAAVFGVLGVVLIQWPHLGGGGGSGVAVAACLLAALTSAIAMLGLNRLGGVDPWAIVVHYSGVATVVVAGVCFVGEPPDLAPLREAKAIWLLLAVGVTATVGQVCVTKAYATGQPARVAVVGLMQIVFALGLDVVFIGPRVHPATLAGIALVLAPTAWMMAARARRQPELSRDAERSAPARSAPRRG